MCIVGFLVPGQAKLFCTSSICTPYVFLRDDRTGFLTRSLGQLKNIEVYYLSLPLALLMHTFNNPCPPLMKNMCVWIGHVQMLTHGNCRCGNYKIYIWKFRISKQMKTNICWELPRKWILSSLARPSFSLCMCSVRIPYAFLTDDRTCFLTCSFGPAENTEHISPAWP